jgi:hypothetical protein
VLKKYNFYAWMISHRFKNINTKRTDGGELCMPAQWTADLIGEMHLARVSKKQLAEHLGVTPEYVSMVLNGHREPDGAVGRFREALAQIVSAQRQDTKAEG